MTSLTHHLWAKAGAGEGIYHPLSCHLVDVGAVAEAILERAVPMSVHRRLGQLATGQTLSAWCALHDLGKASPAFQAKRTDLAHQVETDGLPVGTPLNPQAAPHGLVTAWRLPEVLTDRGADRVGARTVAAVLAAHHGLFPAPAQLLNVHRSLAGEGAWSECRAALAEEILSAFAAEVPRRPLDISEAVLLAGLCSVADWIGSNVEWFPYAPDGGDDPGAYLVTARRQANRAIDDVSWEPWSPTARSFVELFSREPRPLQVEVEGLAATLDGPALFIIEAPMGEGKTEAALLLAQALAFAVGYGGFYFALPTQATANQMLERLVAFLAGSLGTGTANLQLMHGAAWLNPTAQQLRAGAAVDLESVFDDSDPHARVVAAEWFTHKKRGLLSPFGVGTVDQVLLAGMRAKHVFVRLFGLAGKVVVIDEAHAYDTYMSTVLDRTIEWLGALGASVVVLSATLPTSRRSELVTAWERGTGVSVSPNETADAYPLVTKVDAGGVRLMTPAATEDRTVRLVEQPWKMSEPVAIAEALFTAVGDGGCVAALCNTVAEAQGLYRAVLDRDGDEPELWTGLAHSRFCADERANWEQDLRERFGPPPSRMRPERGILVATQVVEQSLDLDFDLLLTALAPIDLMLQRIGRLHRHARTRPARWQQPTCWWIGPPLDEADLPLLREWPSAAVYDAHLLLRSWVLCRQCAAIELPGDLRRLIDAVYGTGLDAPAELAALWSETAEQLRRSRRDEQAQAQSRFLPPPDTHPALAALSLDPSLEDNDANPAVQALTRLGPPSITVVCLWSADGLASLTRDGSQPVDLSVAPDAGIASQLIGRSMPLSISPARRRFARELEGTTPRAWRDSPWLHSARLLLLDPGGDPVQIGGLDVRLDDQLGLVVGRTAVPR